MDEGSDEWIKEEAKELQRILNRANELMARLANYEVQVEIAQEIDMGTYGHPQRTPIIYAKVAKVTYYRGY